MGNVWKYFISGFDSQNDILTLRKIFPKHSFKNGMHKNTKGVYALVNTKTKEYGDKKPSIMKKLLTSKGIVKESTEIIFWPPSVDRDSFDYSAYQKTSFLGYIPVTLDNGKVVNIIPAAGEPKELIFGGDYEEERIPMASLYSKASEYGSLAYELAYLEDELKDKGGLLVNDKRVLKLVELAMINSYSLPHDMLNWLSLVSFKDINSIYQAAMGANQHFLEQLVGES